MRDKQMIDYSLLRSKRKTLAIHITKSAAVEVRAPLRTPKSVIDKFVNSKEEWINSNLEKRRLLLAEKAAFSLDYGSAVTFLAKQYTIAAGDVRNARFAGECLLVPAGLEHDGIKRAVIKLYREKAAEIFSAKVACFAQIMGVTPRTIRISEAKTRWGSCSVSGGITFSWRLIMADEQTVDYVVVHELAHIREHNHSTRFWVLVEEVISDYPEIRNRLKILHSKLIREDWE